MRKSFLGIFFVYDYDFRKFDKMNKPFLVRKVNPKAYTRHTLLVDCATFHCDSDGIVVSSLYKSLRKRDILISVDGVPFDDGVVLNGTVRVVVMRPNRWLAKLFWLKFFVQKIRHRRFNPSDRI